MVQGQPISRMAMPRGVAGAVFLGLGGLFWGLGIVFLMIARLWLNQPEVTAGAYVWLGLAAVLTLAFAAAYWLYRRTLPKDTYAYCPVHYEQWFQMDFVAPSANDKLYVWLNLDIASTVQSGGQLLCVDLQSARDGRWRRPAFTIFHWHRIQETQCMPPTERQPISVLLNVTMKTRFSGDSGTGSIRCLARVARLSDIHPGEHVTLRGCVHSSNVPLHEFMAEAFVARAA